MKSWIGILGHLTIISVILSFGSFSFRKRTVYVPTELRTTMLEPASVDKESIDNAPQITPIVFLDDSFIGFKEALAFKESQGNYDTINTLGYLGKYQFGKGTLKLMGVTDLDAFLNNPIQQETLFKMNVARNKWILRRDIKRFVGKTINGTLVTESGIVAAAHLAGAGNVKKYLRSFGQKDFSDAYGSTVAYYIRRFGGYDVSAVAAEHGCRI
ncbi:MAG: hypothetical protein AAGF77_02070 [Bacteroidota bacterium]